MEPINGVGNQTYVMPQQTQMQNVDHNLAPMAQDYGAYSAMPDVYEPEVPVKKKGSSNILGMTLLGLTTAAVGGLIGKKMGAKGLQEAQNAASEAKKLCEAASKEKAEIKTALDKERTLGRWARFKRWINPESGLTKTEIEARDAAMKSKEEAKKAEKAAKKAEKAAKKGADKASEKGAEKAGEAAKNNVDDAADAAKS